MDDERVFEMITLVKVRVNQILTMIILNMESISFQSQHFNRMDIYRESQPLSKTIKNDPGGMNVLIWAGGCVEVVWLPSYILCWFPWFLGLPQPRGRLAKLHFSHPSVWRDRGVEGGLLNTDAPTYHVIWG